MEDEKGPSVVLRNRTPRDRISVRDTVRESLLSDSTSGIVKGDEDSTSISTSKFSSPEMEISNKELLELFGNEKIRKSVQYEDDFNEIEFSEIAADEKFASDKRKTEGTKIVADAQKVVPDGGWGWVVVGSSFLISMIADGISFSFGLLYIEFLDEFKASKATTAWIGSLFIAVPLLSGPVMSALVDRYGCRKMTILGGIISTLGFVLASISTTLEMMMITFGVIAGLGLGLVYVTAVVSIAYWFEKKRNFAVGLGACGTGVGTFVYAPMTQYFIDEYGWRGTILLLSGTLLNLCVCGCVMRDPEWWIEEQRKQNCDAKEDTKSKFSSSVSIANGCNDLDIPIHGKNMMALIKNGMSAEKVIKDEAANILRRESLLALSKQYRKKSSSLVNIPTYLTYSDKTSRKPLETRVKKTNEGNTEFQIPSITCDSSECDKNNDNSLPVVKFNNELYRTHSERFDHNKDKMLESCQLEIPKLDKISKPILQTKENKSLIKQDSKESTRVWFKKQLSVNHHYLKDLKMPINSIGHRNAILNIKRYKLKASSCPDIFKNSMVTVYEEDEKWYDCCVTCLGDMFNVDLFKKITFNLLCVGTIIIFIWFIVPYFYLAEHMIQKGYSEDDGAFMLSLIGITNTIGMVSLGWIGDFPSVSLGNLYAVCLLLCGCSVAAMPLAAGYWWLASISAAFGLLFAASFTFTPSLLVTLVCLDEFTAAYGLVLMAMGIGHLIGPPLSGLIYDVTLSWELSFYLAGGWIIVAGVLIAFIQPVKNYYERRNVAEYDSSMA